MRLACVVVVCLLPTVAAAQDAPAEPPATPAPAPAPTPAPVPAAPVPVATSALWIGAQLDLFASSHYTIAAMGQSFTISGSAAIGPEGIIDYRIGRYVTIGIAPRVLVGAEVDGSTGTGFQFDLRGRVTAGDEVAPRVHLHGIAQAGYSFLEHSFDYDNGMGSSLHVSSNGFIFGFGAGVAYTYSSRMLITGEISHQWGRQHATVQGVDYEASANDWTLAGGILVAMD